VKVGTEFSKFTTIRAEVPQGSVLGPTLYLLYTTDIPCDNTCLTALFAVDTVIAARSKKYENAVENLQKTLVNITRWAKKWKIALNENKSVRVDFALRLHGYVPSIIDGKPVPIADSARYLGLHLDCRLNWAENIRQKRNYLNLLSRKYYWLIGHRSTLSLQNKKLIHTSTLKPVWMYGRAMWGEFPNPQTAKSFKGFKTNASEL
jgi:hypothetical protein